MTTDLRPGADSTCPKGTADARLHWPVDGRPDIEVWLVPDIGTVNALDE
ncbi:MAG: hypothetical protein ACJ72A_13170 [Nocardioidaceae bacterium]